MGSDSNSPKVAEFLDANGMAGMKLELKQMWSGDGSLVLWWIRKSGRQRVVGGVGKALRLMRVGYVGQLLVLMLFWLLQGFDDWKFVAFVFFDR